MKALTLWQPWASAIASGIKACETRSWRTPYRGPLAIHAAKRPIDAEFRELNASTRDLTRAMPGVLIPSGLPLGAIVATCRLIAIVSTDSVMREPSLWGVTERDQRWGDFSCGRWIWILRDVRPIGPIDCAGGRGLWEWDGIKPDATLPCLFPDLHHT